MKLQTESKQTPAGHAPSPLKNSLSRTLRALLHVRPISWFSRLFAGGSTRARLLRVFLPIAVGIIIVENCIDTFLAVHTPREELADFINAAAAVIITIIAVSRVSKKIGDRLDDGRKESELVLEALHSSENKFRGLSENSPAGIYLIQDGCFVYANPTFAEIFGYSREEATGLKVEAVVAEQDLDLVLGNVEKRMANVLPTIHYTFQGKRKDGSIIDIEVFGSRTEYRGRPGVIGTLLDITERNKADQLLKRASNLYEKTLSSLNETVFISDPMTRTISRCNVTAERMFGYTQNELLGRNTRFLHVNEEMYREFGVRAVNALQQGTCTSFQFKMRRKNGEVFDTEHFITPLIDDDGSLLGIVSVIRDISECIHNQRVIEEILRQQKALLNNIPDMAWLKDADCRFIAVNEAFGKACGLRPDELVGQTDLDVWPRNLALNYQADDREVMASGKRKVVEEPLADKEGKIIWIETIKTPIYDDKGMIIGTTGVARDITVRRQSQDIIRVANERFQAVLDSLDAFVYVSDFETYEVLFTNKFGRDLFGEIVGKKCYQAMNSGATQPCSYCSNQKLLSKADILVGTNSWEFEDTRTGKWYHIQDRAIRWTNGRMVKLGIATDITDRKKTEKLLLETERRFREIFENVQLVAISLDCNATITFCNDFMLKLTGYRKEELLGKNWFELLVPKDEKARDIFLEEGCVGGMPLHHEYQIVTKQGEPRIISWNNIMLRDHNGVVTGLASLGEDITTRKKLEAKLLHTQKMESIGTLAGGIAHDFNNILTAIIGFGNVLSRKLPEDDPLTFYVDQILDASESAANLTRSLLAFGRKQIMNPKPQDLNRIVEKLERFLKRIIGEDIEFTTTLEEAPLEIMADFSQMEQVLMNLAANARDAMPKGGSLTIRTGRIRLGNEFAKAHGYGMPGEYAILSIGDTGIGMDDKTRERVFEPFFTTKEVNKGTGLGLSIVYGIVKQHNGYIAIESAPGRGTTVNVYLPLLPDPEEIDSEPGKRNSSAPRSKGKETVLIAEDNQQIRELVSTVLSESGYTIIVAEDGEIAIELAQKNGLRIDLFLLDVIMPRKNGAEVYASIVKNKPDAKVLFLSGYPADIVDVNSIGKRNFDFLAKPVAPFVLLTKVRDVLDGAGTGAAAER